MSQPLQYSIILTRLTETGQALMQLNSRGYVDIETARHLVAAGLAEPERIRVEIRHLPSREFEGIGLTSEGSVAVKNLDQQMALRSGLSDSRFFTTGHELSDSEQVVTCGYLGWLGEDALSQLDRRFAWSWCPEMPDPLAAVWEPVLLPILERDPAVQAVTLMRHLQLTHPEAFPDDRVRRTLERRVRDWRALHGPERDVIFRQTPEPGRMALSDFTDASALGVTIGGQPLEHRLYHFVLAYSSWEHVAVVLGGESFTALAENLQNALWTLGGVPHEHRTDSLSAAYRNLDAAAAEDVTKRYEAFCAHYGMLASRNNRGEAHENGSVEAHNNHLKVAIDQALILRGSRDFAELADWRRFVDELVARRNRRREAALRIDMAALKPLPARRTTDFTEVVARVTKTGGFVVHQVFYSAPSQLIGQRLRVHVYDDRIEAFLGATHVVTHPRRRGREDGLRVHCVNYRHVIHALRRKPQALAGSVYRDGLFPRSEYAEAWTALSAALPRRDACRRMVDLLCLAHDEGCEVELALLIADTLRQGELPEAHRLKERLEPPKRALPDDTPVALTELASFDALLEGCA